MGAERGHRHLERIAHRVRGAQERLRGGARNDSDEYIHDRGWLRHHRRYAIDARKIERELGWRPAETFASGLRKTVRWYLDHAEWVRHVQSGAYRDWVATNYAGRSAA